MRSISQIPDYMNYPVYLGQDLGLTYSARSSKFRIWSPVAEKVQLSMYADALGGEPLERIDMLKSGDGTWVEELHGDYAGKFYTFRVYMNGSWKNEVPDPYAKIVGVNGRRAMVGDLSQSDPQGWAKDKSPAFRHPTDAVIYELHIRDASIDASSGISEKGKFIGLAEKGTKSSEGFSTGLDHLKELGITHVHLLPSFDFYSIDETRPGKAQYNWGYEPLNYNVPEGSYSTNATDGYTRIREFKQLIKTLHENGIRVVMDVVYNHTMLTEESWFNQLVPGYYYRQDKKGGFSNASACGNETASDRPMMRKFILESLRYWVSEYHVDGFRFDLMGIHDIETMNQVSSQLKMIKPDILLYGEGWTAGASPLPENKRAIKTNVSKLDGVAVFSDDIRDAIKGSVFEHKDSGFISGKKGIEEMIKFGIVASTKHPQLSGTKQPYATSPGQIVTYCECHDNHVLWDKLAISNAAATEAERRNMHKLALSIVLTSQGISFLHAGTEFLRSKKGVENSYNSPDSINAIDWGLKKKNHDVFEYTKGLIEMRKSHPAFRMTNARELAQGIKFRSSSHQLVSYTIDGAAVGDSWKKIYVAFNGSGESRRLDLPSGKWKAYILNNRIRSTSSIPQEIGPYSAAVLYID
ncbi:MAG TPA: type I pullulanase [Chitinophagaceae bacterium]|nr:type I pullulanase [Chitinophagaceae bacterium]